MLPRMKSLSMSGRLSSKMLLQLRGTWIHQFILHSMQTQLVRLPREITMSLVHVVAMGILIL